MGEPTEELAEAPVEHIVEILAGVLGEMMAFEHIGVADAAVGRGAVGSPETSAAEAAGAVAVTAHPRASRAWGAAGFRG